MKFFMILGFVFSAGIGKASSGESVSCAEKLLGNASSSRAFLLYSEEELGVSFSAIEGVVKMAIKSVGCESSELKLDSSTLSCRSIVPSKPWTKVCYVESTAGYFIISKDLVSSMNIMYNRWD